MRSIERRLGRIEAEIIQPRHILVWRDTRDTDADVRKKVDARLTEIGGTKAGPVEVCILLWSAA